MPRNSFARCAAPFATLFLSLPAFAPPAPPTPPQCSGCDALASIGNDHPLAGAEVEDYESCPHTPYSVKIRVTPQDGNCNLGAPCQGSPCSYTIDLRWKLPPGQLVEWCDHPPGQASPRCHRRWANGTHQKVESTAELSCDNRTHIFSIAMTSLCQEKASVYVRCTRCVD